jgi:hypothetical protein
VLRAGRVTIATSLPTAGRRAAGLVVAMVVTMILAACDNAPPPLMFPPTGRPTAKAPRASITTGSTSRGNGFGAPAPGNALKIGQSATVGLDRSGKTTTVQVTTVSVTRGNIRDFADYQLDAGQRASTPYYVRATFANVGRVTLTSPGLTKLMFAFTPAGDRASPVSAPGFHLCDGSEPFPWGPGGILSECATYFVPASTSVSTVIFQANTHQDAIVWKTS